MIWYSHRFKNFPQFVVIDTVKGFGVLSKAVVDIFLKLSCFFDDPVDVGNRPPNILPVLASEATASFNISCLFFFFFL